MVDVPDERAGAVFWAGGLVRFLLYYTDEGLTRSSRFNILHPERIPSAMARYSAEVRRILSILDGHLATSPYLVGDKLTYADFSFIPWNSMVDILPGESKEEVFKGYKNVVRWQDSIMARDSWKKCVDTRAIL